MMRSSSFFAPRVALRGLGLALPHVRSFSSTPTIPSACPYQHDTPIASTVSRQALTTEEMQHCPVVGTTPPVACPIEAEETVLLQRQQPTLKEMASQMGKTQLSAYVAATALAGYVLGGGVSPLVATVVTGGTFLQSCSANTANQIIEAPYDAMMKRTCRRPLPMKFITPRKAMLLSASELAIGTSVLYMISPAAAALGVLNWTLYVCMYTPLKRVSALNTWFGSIVGGLPPLMGGVAVAGTIAPQVWMLASLLFIWQIPHFNGLAFHCRRDYEAAGYKMLAFYNPWRASFYAVALSVLMAFITLLAPAMMQTPVEGSWYYPVTAAANAVMIYKSVLFHRDPVRHCRGCFVFSYVYLSVMLAAIMLNHVQPLHRIDKAVAYFCGSEAEQTAERSVAV